MITQLIVLGLYFSFLLIIGINASKKIRTISDYYVGGKKLGYWIAALSARSTGESGWLLIGVTGMGAMIGFSALWIVVGEVIGVLVSWHFMAKKFKRITNEHESITIPDFLVSRFNSTSNLIRVVSATALSFFVIIYVSAQIDITGKTFESFMGLNYYTGIFLGFGIVVLYVVFGGFLAVAWSDFFQGTLMFFGLLILPIFLFIHLNQEGDIISRLDGIDSNLLSIWGASGFSFMGFMEILGFLSIGIGFMGSPQVYVRFIAIKDEAEIEKGKWVAVAYTFITDTAAVLIGVFGRVLLTNAGDNPELVLGNAGENLLALVLYQTMPAFIIGVYISAVLSAVMSTVDSLLVLASSAVTRDFYQQIYNPNIDEGVLVVLSKKVTVFLSVLALLVTLVVSVIVPGRTVFWFVIFGWSGIAATFCPVIILSLFWKKYTEKGAISSMIAGFLCVPFFKFYVSELTFVGPYIKSLDVMFPSVILAMFAGWFVSTVTK